MLSARGPRPAWFTPRETGGAGGDALKRTGMGVLGCSTPRSATPKNYGAPASYCRADPAAGVPPAGKAGELLLAGGIASRRGLQKDIVVPTPRSPNGLSAAQKRHRQKGEPGKISLHWGLNELPIPDPCEGYGVKTNKGEDVAQNFRSGQQFGVAEYINARAEDVYESTKREPLGKTWMRNHVLPKQVYVPEFPGFGKETERSDHTSKDAIFPRGVAPDTEEIRLQYKRTHGNTMPGERSGPDYSWPAAVKDNPLFRFGVCDANADVGGRGAGARAALSMDCGDEPLSVPKTNILKDALANFLEVGSDQQSASRNLMQGETQRKLPPGHAFGKASTSDPISAGSLIRGSHSIEEQMPDADLGKCITKGRRNFETHRPLGIPSVRHDIRAPPLERRSVANATNFGDDLGAGSLITPTRFQFQGVGPEDFHKRRSPADLESLLLGAGCTMQQSDLKAILQDAASLHGDGDERASLEAVMIAITHWTNAH